MIKALNETFARLTLEERLLHNY